MNRSDRTRRGRRGATLAGVAIVLPALLGMAALAVDVGRLMVEKQHLQQLCDASAKAGGAELPAASEGQERAFERAEQVAAEYARANGAEDRGVQLSAQAQSGPSGCQLRVSATEEVPMAFARIWGWATRPVSARAVAEREPPRWIPLAWSLSPGQGPDDSFRIRPLSGCNSRQWFVDVAGGSAIRWDRALTQGANVGLTSGKTTIALRRNLDQLSDRQAPAAMVRWLEQVRNQQYPHQVQMLLVDDATQDRAGLSGQATFQRYATVEVAPGGEARELEIRFVKISSGSLGAGDAAGAGEVRLIQ